MYTLKWQGNSLSILDQTKLPVEVEYIDCKDYKRVIEAIRRLEVRGAPAIGAAAAFALTLAAQELAVQQSTDFIKSLEFAKQEIAQARPTAVNLFWALEKVWQAVDVKEKDINIIVKQIETQAVNIYNQDITANKQIGKFGAGVIPQGSVLTHCNAGALATCGWGTALGVVREAFAQNKIAMVYADETRPLLQGARITAWELAQDNIPVTVITDSMAGWVMKKGFVQSIVTGADRIAANGDTANKIGTYSLAVLAKEHNIPLYIAAPVSTIDFSLTDGEGILIEERDCNEVRQLCGVQTTPQNIKVYNPAFDVTPQHLIAGIITEYGVLQGNLAEAILNLKNKIGSN